MKKCLWLLFLAALLLPGCKKKSGEVVEIRWFVGLGAGSEASMLEPQKKVVEKFNSTHENVKIKLDIVAVEAATNALATQFTAGNPPDIVGPVGQSGRNTFRGSWLDLEDLIDDADVDLSVYEQALVDFFKSKEEGQVGLPFAVYPSFLFVNKDMFAEAKIPLPPQTFNSKYTTASGEQVPWDMDAMIKVAKQLTVDKNGNISGSDKFDSGKISQWGFGAQWQPLREVCTLFGPGKLHDNNNNPIFPAHWRKAIHTWYNGMWKEGEIFYPNGVYQGAPAPFPGEELFASGRVGMVQTHLWYASFMEPSCDWDIYATPAYNGKTTTPLDSDTFFIPKASKHPEEAFIVYQYLIKDALPELSAIYGGLPAINSMQDEFLKSLSAKYPGKKITWQVAKDSLKYVDIPGYEGWEPNPIETSTVVDEFWKNLLRTKGLDDKAIDDKLDRLVSDLKPVMAAKK